MNKKLIAYCAVPIPSGVFVKKREKIYDRYTAFRVISFDNEAFELIKCGKGNHRSVWVSAQLVCFCVPRIGYIPYYYLTTEQLLKALGV